MWKVVAIALLAAACTKSTPPRAPRSGEAAAIEAVLAEFRRAIIEHQEQALLATMIDGDVPFRSRNVADGSLSASTAADFAKFVAGEAKPIEERFWNVSIAERGGIAVLDADYEFLLDKKATNHGREVWTLLRTPQGWKITMVTWTVVVGPAPAGSDRQVVNRTVPPARIAKNRSR